MDLGWTPDAPAVYRVSASAESGFSGPVSDASGATRMTAAFRVTPTSDSEARVEVLYLAASVEDASGESVALDLGGLAGSEATARFGTPGVVSEVEGGERLMDAPIPLIRMEAVIQGLFPPLPEGSFRPDDTWTGDTLPLFDNLAEGEDPARMRYVVGSVGSSGKTGKVEGYELAVEPGSFQAETPGGAVSGEGNLGVEFEGDLDTQTGYQRTERRSNFHSNFLRLEGGDYANGNLDMSGEMTVERLDPAEQFGLDV